ncbi:hypothetical protein [Falsihalocynthiibacter sp. CO-5D18]|uniref:hypothetical protein n=1 Tax=Falsihalocynthiibacter sp. CO-5D18 TaxID=3240872 RepID=UPI00350F9426
MFGVWGGFKVVKEMAQEIGIDHKLYGTALTEMKVNYGHFKETRKKAIALGEPPSIVQQDLAIWSIGPALLGLDVLTMRYPEQSSIWEAKVALAKFAFRHDLIEKPDIELLRSKLLQSQN